MPAGKKEYEYKNLPMSFLSINEFRTCCYCIDLWNGCLIIQYSRITDSPGEPRLCIYFYRGQ